MASPFLSLPCLCRTVQNLSLLRLCISIRIHALANLCLVLPQRSMRVDSKLCPCPTFRCYSLAIFPGIALPSRCNVLPLRLPTRPHYAASMPTVAMPSRFPALLCPLHSRTQLCLCSQLCEFHCPRNPLLRAALALLNRAIANIVIALPLRFLADLSLCISNPDNAFSVPSLSMPSLSPGCDASATPCFANLSLSRPHIRIDRTLRFSTGLIL